MKRLLKTRALVAFLLFLLALSSSRAVAQNPVEFPPGEPPPHAGQDADWREALGLTPEQMSRIREIRERHRAERQSAHQRLVQARRALDQAIYADEVNEGEVERLARELAEAQGAEVRLRAATELSIRRVLTAEQLNTFRAIRMRRMRDAQLRRRGDEGGPNRPQGGPPLEGGIGPGRPRRRGGLPGRIRP